MPNEFKQSSVSITGTSHMDLSNCADEDLAALDEDQLPCLVPVGQAMSSYIRTAADLLEGKYSHLRNLAPPYLRNPGKILVICCDDGIAIRFDSDAERQVAVAWSTEPLGELVSKLSQDLIRCYRDPLPKPIPDHGIYLTIHKQSPEGT